MRVIRASGGGLLAAAAFAVSGLLFVPAAWGTFPGRSGSLIIARSYDAGPHLGILSSKVEAISPSSGRPRVLQRCGAAEPPAACMFQVARASPDGRRLALSVGYGLKTWLVTVGLDGSERRVFPQGAGVNDYRGWGVRWAPPGERLLSPGTPATGLPGNLAFFTSDGAVAPGPAQAVVQYPYRANETRPISGGEGFDVSSRNELAAGVYTRYCVAPNVGPEQICTGSDIFIGTKRITFRGGESPSWSPHGQWIAFTRNTRRVSAAKDPDVFVMRRDGSRLRRLTYHGGTMPAWSPDGRRIAFLREGYLYTVSPKRRALRKYGRYASNENQPWFVTSLDWQPRPR